MDDWRGGVGEQIASARREKGWEKGDLEAHADVSYHSVTAAEAGTIANLNNLNLILEALDLRLEAIAVPRDSPPVRWTTNNHDGSDVNTVQDGTTERQHRAVDLRRENRPMTTTWQKEALYALVRGLDHEDDQLAAIDYLKSLIWKRRNGGDDSPPTANSPNPLRPSGGK